jgi:glutamyl-tRNA synthetase
MNSNLTTSEQVITRFPPSPTGPFHIGNVRTALFNYFFAKQKNGLFVVRVEDTDKTRSKKEYEEGMLDSLAWLGLKRDGELWHQSERTDIYKKYLQELIQINKAYISVETEGENKEVVRFKNPNTVITFTDLIRGDVTFDTTELGDFIIARNIEDPVYHLAVVIDDFETGVTHIIRGEDHVSNTPRQILIQEAIGAPRPIYAHLPLILAPDRSKLSKRKHGESVSLDYYRKKGYLPEALVNYMALLGWNPGTEQEIFTLEQLIQSFDISKIQKGGAIFNEEKLKWFNKEHMKRLPAEALSEQVIKSMEGSKHFSSQNWKVSKELSASITKLVVERISVWSEAEELADAGEFDWIFQKPKGIEGMIFWKEDKDPNIAKERLSEAAQIISNIPDSSWTVEEIKAPLWSHAEKIGKGNFLWPLRVSLSGKEKSPDPFTLISVLGKAESLARIESAKAVLK